MGQWDDSNEGETSSGLSEIEQMQLDAVLLETAYDNSYLVLTDQITFEDLMHKRFHDGHEAIMAYDPTNGPELEELTNMISYYIEIEAYERCAKIQKIIDNICPEMIKE